MKPWLAFAWLFRNPTGGLSSYIGAFETWEEAAYAVQHSLRHVDRAEIARIIDGDLRITHTGNYWHKWNWTARYQED